MTVFGKPSGFAGDTALFRSPAHMKRYSGVVDAMVSPAAFTSPLLVLLDVVVVVVVVVFVILLVVVVVAAAAAALVILFLVTIEGAVRVDAVVAAGAVEAGEIPVGSGLTLLDTAAFGLAVVDVDSTSATAATAVAAAAAAAPDNVESSFLLIRLLLLLSCAIFCAASCCR